MDWAWMMRVELSLESMLKYVDLVTWGCLHVVDTLVVAFVAELGGFVVVVVVMTAELVLLDVEVGGGDFSEEAVIFDVEVGGGGRTDEVVLLEVDVEVGGGGMDDELVFVVTDVDVGGGGLTDVLVLEIDVEEGGGGGGGGDFVDVLGCVILELILP